MKVFYNKTSIGYSHLKSNIVVQDYSDTYFDKKRIIVTACDGHGGKIYFRSDKGSKFASIAIINTFKKVSLKKLKNLEKIKLDILCEWNKLVEEDLMLNPLNLDDLKGFNEKEIFKITSNPEVVYGTTLNGVLYYNNHYLCVQLGDGGVISLKDNKFNFVFEEDEDNVANLTYSLCSEDAFNYLKIKLIDEKLIDGIIVCTDGLLSPYQSIKNLNDYFIKPTLKLIKQKGIKSGKKLDSFINKLALKTGVGDDVSLGLIIDHKEFIKL